jgi:hypothetical protein
MMMAEAISEQGGIAREKEIERERWDRQKRPQTRLRSGPLFIRATNGPDATEGA